MKRNQNKFQLMINRNIYYDVYKTNPISFFQHRNSYMSDPPPPPDNIPNTFKEGTAFLRKQSVKVLKHWCNCVDVDFPTSAKKADLINALFDKYSTKASSSASSTDSGSSTDEDSDPYCSWRPNGK